MSYSFFRNIYIFFFNQGRVIKLYLMHTALQVELQPEIMYKALPTELQPKIITNLPVIL